MRSKVMILSSPKSGTYLCSEVVKNFGFNQTYLHISPEDYTAYDSTDIQEGRYNPDRYKVVGTMEESLKLVTPGNFAVGHLRAKYSDYLTDFKKIVLTRNKEDRRDSWNRFFNGKIRKLQPFVDIPMTSWIGFPNTFHIDFNSLLNKDTDVLDKMQIFLFNDILYNSLEVIEKSLISDTITKSNIRISIG